MSCRVGAFGTVCLALYAAAWSAAMAFMLAMCARMIAISF